MTDALTTAELLDMVRRLKNALKRKQKLTEGAEVVLEREDGTVVGAIGPGYYEVDAKEGTHD